MLRHQKGTNPWYRLLFALASLPYTHCKRANQNVYQLQQCTMRLGSCNQLHKLPKGEVVAGFARKKVESRMLLTLAAQPNCTDSTQGTEFCLVLSLVWIMCSHFAGFIASMLVFLKARSLTWDMVCVCLKSFLDIKLRSSAGVWNDCDVGSGVVEEGGELLSTIKNQGFLQLCDICYFCLVNLGNLSCNYFLYTKNLSLTFLPIVQDYTNENSF
jgi:hypothetical protein